MKIKVNRRQFDLLLKNMEWLNGMALEMKGNTFKTIVANSKVIKESKMFEVDMLFGSISTKFIIHAHNGAEASMLARKMFPHATIFSTTRVKGRMCYN